MAGRVPARQARADYDFDYQPSVHDIRTQRVIASGGVEAVTFAVSSIASAGFISTRVNDIAWALGTAGLGFFVAGGARQDAMIRDFALGAMSGALATATLRFMGKMNRFNGQQ